VKRFKDGKGREWDLIVHVGQMKKLRDVLDIDLNKIDQPEGAKVFSDPCLFVDMLYVLCAEQCKERGITDVSFGEGMVGGSLDDAASAFIEALADFFPSHRSAILRAQMTKGEKIRDEAMAKALTLIDGLTLEQLTLSKSPTD